MIQRIQSIFLLLVTVTLVAMQFFPLWEKVDVDKNEKLTLTTLNVNHYAVSALDGSIEIMNTTATYPIAGLSLIAACIALFSIFKYENRLTQMKLGALNSLIIGGSLGFSVYYIFAVQDMLAQSAQVAYLPGFYFTAAALFFNALANRFIRRDEKLVRSADRIR